MIGIDTRIKNGDSHTISCNRSIVCNIPTNTRYRLQQTRLIQGIFDNDIEFAAIDKCRKFLC